MPKRPTLRARAAETQLLRLLEGKAGHSGVPLPPVRQLGKELGLSFATVSRLLQRFVKEGRAWQHPNGRFFPMHAASQAAKGLPIVLLGRQIQHWSRLYREILGGVSEVCTARGCPLVFLSSDKLVQHDSPEMPPVFASAAIRKAELQRLANAMPRLCAGILFDHLWDEKLISEDWFPPAPRLLLARPSNRSDVLSIAPDFKAGAHMILQYLCQKKCERIHAAVPFAGDQAVDAASAMLHRAVATGSYPFRSIEPLDCSTPAARKAAISRLAKLRSRSAIICPEDNIASLLWHDLMDRSSPQNITLVSMQGTGAIGAPITHLRYDYAQLGRDAVTFVIERQRNDLLLSPRLIPGTA